MPKSCHGLTTLVLIAQAVFLLECGQTHRQTDATDHVKVFPPNFDKFPLKLSVCLCVVFLGSHSHTTYSANLA